MIVTGMFFAQVARAAEGKLDVLGGVYDNLVTDRVGTGSPERVTLVVLVQREGADDQDPDPTIKIEAFTPAGEELALAEIHYRFQSGSENGFVYADLPILFASEGRYTFNASASGSDYVATLGLRVRSPGARA